MWIILPDIVISVGLGLTIHGGILHGIDWSLRSVGGCVVSVVVNVKIWFSGIAVEIFKMLGLSRRSVHPRLVGMRIRTIFGGN